MSTFRERLEAGEQMCDVVLTTRGIEPRFPAEFWWCTTCGEPCFEDPCQHCGEPIRRYRVVPATDDTHEGQEQSP